MKFKPTLMHHHQHMRKTMGKGLNATVSDMWKEASILIGCDNDACQIKWYQMSCLKMKELPEGDWFCRTCHRLT